MGDPIRIEFGTQSDPGRYGPEAGPRHINAYVEETIEGQPPLPIYSTPGLTTFATISGGGATRGMISMDPTNMVALSGNQLVRIDNLGTVTIIGSIAGTAFATMARNSAAVPQLAIVVDGNPYVVTNYVLAAINDPQLPAPNSVFFLDQRLVFTIPDGRLFWTDIDAINVDALSFATAEGAPDGLIRGFAHRLDAWLFGAETTEIWRSTSDATSAFQRVSGGFIPKGCSAPFSVAELGQTIYWIGDDFIPYSALGYTMKPLNHGPVCRAIKGCADKGLITGFSYYQDGYGFWEISGGSATPWTWVYNESTDKWFEKQSYGMTRSRVQFGVHFAGSNVVGNTSAGVLYTMNSSSFDEAGNDMVMTLRSSPMHSYPNRVSVDRLYADFVTGVGLNSIDTDEANPSVGLRWSDDGGRSFSRQIVKSLGTQGSYETRVVWNSLGITGRQGRIWELQVSSPVIRAVRYAAIEGEEVGT